MKSIFKTVFPYAEMFKDRNGLCAKTELHFRVSREKKYNNYTELLDIKYINCITNVFEELQTSLFNCIHFTVDIV